MVGHVGGHTVTRRETEKEKKKTMKISWWWVERMREMEQRYRDQYGRERDIEVMEIFDEADHEQSNRCISYMINRRQTRSVAEKFQEKNTTTKDGSLIDPERWNRYVATTAWSRCG